ncbi:hypothetical protein [Pseudomonas sp. MNR3A]|uniref:hypothetical protein n=1 Tax=Pseudomonas sp. MNR3A TaxID=2615213 RepID=UPI00129AE767|nr:hypothetical protein [Pseudomonas sp. MNR3A]
MTQFLEIEDAKGRHIIVNKDFIIGLSPLTGELNFQKGAVLMVHRGTKEGNFAKVALKPQAYKKVREFIIPTAK